MYSFKKFKSPVPDTNLIDEKAEQREANAAALRVELDKRRKEQRDGRQKAGLIPQQDLKFYTNEKILPNIINNTKNNLKDVLKPEPNKGSHSDHESHH